MSAARSALSSSSQLPLPLPAPAVLSRADLIVSAANERAVACIDAWPDWPVSVLALYGPGGCGKTHLVSIWREASQAVVVSASALCRTSPPGHRALAIEDVDSAQCSRERDAGLFAAVESAGRGCTLLLTGRRHPTGWAVALPDLASRLAAIPAFPLWAPDEEILARLARKLFADRQLPVGDFVVEQMLQRIERSPGAIRQFVAELDAAALAESRPVNLALLRRLLSGRNTGPQ